MRPLYAQKRFEIGSHTLEASPAVGLRLDLE